MALSQYFMQLCSETLVSDIRHVSELLVPGFGRPVSFCRGKMPRPEGWQHACEMVTEQFAKTNLNVVVAKWWFLVFVV